MTEADWQEAITHSVPEKYLELNRTVTDREYRRVCDYALSLGFDSVYLQSKASAGKAFIPTWDE